MADEEMKKTIEFLLEHQAQFASDMEQLTSKVNKLTEAQIKSEARLSRVEEAIVLFTQMAQNLDSRDDILSQRIAELAEAQKQTESVITTLSRQVQSLTKTFERFINENPNGKA